MKKMKYGWIVLASLIALQSSAFAVELSSLSPAGSDNSDAPGTWTFDEHAFYVNTSSYIFPKIVCGNSMRKMVDSECAQQGLKSQITDTRVTDGHVGSRYVSAGPFGVEGEALYCSGYVTGACVNPE